MKVFVEALDSLEINWISMFNCENLMQKHFGVIDVSEFRKYHYANSPSTPIVWASFITGLMPEQHGIMLRKKYKSNFIELARKITIKLGLGKIRGKRKILQAFGMGQLNKEGLFRQGSEYFRKKNIETIFDLAKSKAYNVPTWNWQERRNLLEEYFTNNLKGQEWIDVGMQFLHEDFEKAESIIAKNDWELFMHYVEVIDLAGHTFGGNLEIQKLFYKEVDKLVAKLQKSIGDECLFLIVSDHGMRPAGKFGEHSNRAFWSSNLLIDPPPQNITDWFLIIKNYLTGSREKIGKTVREKEIVEKLREMGYL